jgi:hypothetical protein
MRPTAHAIIAMPHHPVERVVPAVADVDGYPPIGGFKHRVARVPLHIVGGLVEVAHPRDVVLSLGVMVRWLVR